MLSKNKKILSSVIPVGAFNLVKNIFLSWNEYSNEINCSSIIASNCLKKVLSFISITVLFKNETQIYGFLFLYHKIRYICKRFGDVAQLARAFGWQPKGRGFEPHLLHNTKTLTVFILDG